MYENINEKKLLKFEFILCIKFGVLSNIGGINGEVFNYQLINIKI